MVGPGQAWQVDVTPLQGASLAADLAARDLTVNAMAEPLSGGEIVDPHGGREDLAARRLRMVSPEAFAADPLRTLRVARLACELGFAVDPATAAAARAHAEGLGRVSPERVFAELKRIVVADARARRPRADGRARPHGGRAARSSTRCAASARTPTTTATCTATRSRCSQRAIALERDPAATVGDDLAPAVRALLDEPLADGLTRGGGLRFGALLHDAAKPQTRVELRRRRGSASPATTRRAPPSPATCSHGCARASACARMSRR